MRNFVISLKRAHNFSSNIHNMIPCFNLIFEGHSHGMENMKVCK